MENDVFKFYHMYLIVTLVSFAVQKVKNQYINCSDICLPPSGRKKYPTNEWLKHSIETLCLLSNQINEGKPGP